jgi:hypothetical protein
VNCMNQSDTQLLMKIIGMPNIKPAPPKDLTESTLIRLFPLAIRNKMPILFLENALAHCAESEYLQTAYRIYMKKAKLARTLIKQVAQVLDHTQLDYAMFKTIRPFKSFGADVDVILFNRQDFEQACSVLRNNGYELAGYGAFSTTLDTASHEMGVDLHLQISVSRLVYMDTQLLREHVTETNVDGVQVRTLDKPASFVTDATHSIYKEQLLTFSDFYTIVFEILSMNRQELKAMTNLVNSAHATLSARAVLMLTERLVALAFNKTVPQITEAAKLVRVNEIEERIVHFLVANLEQNFKLPYNYPPLAVAAAFVAKICTDSMMRGSLAGQAMELITNMPYLLENILLHMKGPNRICQ